MMIWRNVCVNIVEVSCHLVLGEVFAPVELVDASGVGMMAQHIGAKKRVAVAIRTFKRISTLSKDEIRFVLANKRYSMGKPILSDPEYDALRKTLKEMGSPVVLHGAYTTNK